MARIPTHQSVARPPCRQRAEGVTLGELLHYSTSLSDNIACDRLLAYVGGPDAVDRYVRERPIEGFRIAATERTMHLDPANQRINRRPSSAVCALFARFLEGGLLYRSTRPCCGNCWRARRPAQTNSVQGFPKGSSSATRPARRTVRRRGSASPTTTPASRRTARRPPLLRDDILVTDSPADDAANAAVIAAISKRIYEHFTEKSIT